MRESELDRLLAFAEGRLAPEEAAAMKAFLNSDREASETVARFQAVRATLQTDDSVAPPASVIEQARALFREQRARTTPGESWWESLRRVVAEMVFDGRTQPALAGVRGAATTYQLTFRSDAADVDIEIGRGGGGEHGPRRLTGQVSPHGGLRVERVGLVEIGAHGPAAWSDVDAGGMFELTSGAGRYNIWLASQDLVLVLPDVEVH